MRHDLKQYRIDSMVENFVQKLNDEFKGEYEYDVVYGKKYAKIRSRMAGGSGGFGSAWGFIVMENTNPTKQHPPYKSGDLLKPANWSSPAKWARGNILNGNAAYSIYGPAYLKR